jgi:tetratricopeptide (TPR) repeat protein
MTRESWVLGIAGVCFGVLIGWIIGSQSRTGAVPLAPAPQTQSAPQTQQAPTQGQTAAPLDLAQVQTLTQQANNNPRDTKVRTQLGNLYFDAERYTDAITWYEAVLAIDPRDVNVSTDLAVSYYYTNQTERALQQFDKSLAVDARHLKTLLNMGMVKAFGKQDLNGAAEAWRKVVELAPPDSPEARAAKQALDSLRSAHPDTGGAAPAASPPAPASKGGS